MNFSIFSDKPENEYSESIDSIVRKKYAQYFTPYCIARFMASWVVRGRGETDILDPAVGMGVFIRAAYQINPDLKFTGYEIDENILRKTVNLFSACSINAEILPADFLFHGWNLLYDGILCNPPYISFRNFKRKEEALAEFKSRLGVSLSGFSNIYTLFIIKSLHQLKPGGRAAFIVPLEFLNADYGKIVKEILTESRALRYIIVFKNDSGVFKDVLTTSGIFLFSKDRKERTVNFISLSGMEELTSPYSRLNKYPDLLLSNNSKSVSFKELNPAEKWRIYYNSGTIRKSGCLVPFKKYARIIRGIATGANDYFTFNKRKQSEFNIPDKFLLPCVCKSNQVKSPIFTKADYDELQRKDSNILLFNAGNGKEEHVAEYIRLGEELKVNKRYLTGHRKPWYKVENRPPAPVLAGTFNRTGLRFIRNEAGILNLTAFHCIYVNFSGLDRIDTLFAYLLTDIAREILYDRGREYGSGLNKYEPNDLNNGKIINLDVVDVNMEKTIHHIYSRYRESVIRGESGLSLLNDLNDIFLKLLA
ncbi:MAG: N-6 DNA methylase [Spirochaetes bacterium]|nr:N-6 DNA methylase [Spirochaetota bacterium]